MGARAETEHEHEESGARKIGLGAEGKGKVQVEGGAKHIWDSAGRFKEVTGANSDWFGSRSDGHRRKAGPHNKSII